MADLQDPQSLDNRQLSAIARNPSHPMHTHAKAELDRRKMTKEGAMKRIATTQASKTDRMASTDKKGLETFKKKPTTEAKDPNEYDNEGSMMKSQLRQICSANEKLMSMVKDDDNLPEWVQAKVTKATDYIRSVRDYLESEKMEEKTLTPAELKKREKIAKAIERDNPDMPMDKKMAIATATAKRVAEGAYLKGSLESRADAHEDQADHHNSQAEKAHKAGDKMAASAHKAAARAHMKAASYFDKHLSKPAHLRPQAAGGATSQAAHTATQKANSFKEDTDKNIAEYSVAGLSNYIRKSAADVSKSRGDARRQDKRIGGQKMADDKIRKKMGYSSQAKVPAGANEDTDLTELKTSTLVSYIKKASDWRAKNAYDIGKSGKINYKGLKRRQGINRAVNKIAKEEVELGEGNMASAAKELEAYARKSGGIDKNDFMKAVMLMKRNQSKQLNKFVDELDTEPREKILSVMQKHVKETTESTLARIRKILDK